MACRCIDTADAAIRRPGWKNPGVERALKAIGEADRILLVVDSTAPQTADPSPYCGFLDSKPDPARVT